ncbi:MAG TPA: SRPBCC domain-containing protein [Propylenella sp.]|nr:SRPBCC domain-containing protein [Propylenella sp.]
MGDAIALQVLLPTSREVTWDLVTQPAHLRYWFGSHVSLDARPGGEFREIWSQGGRQVITSGRVDEYDPPHRIGWSWSDDDWTVTTHLRLTLTAVAAGTAVRLLHSGWSGFPEPRGDELRQAHDAGWRQHLDDLAGYAAQHAGTI